MFAAVAVIAWGKMFSGEAEVALLGSVFISKYFLQDVAASIINPIKIIAGNFFMCYDM